RGTMMQLQAINTPGEEALAGAAVYSPALLTMYDSMVLGVSSRLAWRCPAAEALKQYDALVTGNHLDVGVGSGYFLDRCRFPTTRPRLSLLDLNVNSLTYTARRLRRY